MSKSCEDACGCDATPAEGNAGSEASEASGNWISVYTVPKMDCPSEERMIRLALNGFEDIRGLSFDLSDRRLKVVHDGEAEPITAKLATLGLGASLQETAAATLSQSRRSGIRLSLPSRSPAPCVGCSVSMLSCLWWK